MRNLRLRAACAAWLGFFLTAGAGFVPAPDVAASPRASRASGTCVQDSIGIDSALANNSSGTILGEATGQTFYAVDTLLKSLTVWRVASECQNFLIGIHLYITRADSSGRPLTQQIVLDGPSLVVPNGDCVHPIAFQWDFDPPFALPGSGIYAFFLQVPMSQCPSYFDVLGHDGEDAYPPGHLWSTLRTDFCDLPQGLVSWPASDMNFIAVFCDTHSTPILRHTWGELKMRYH
jgi:hypothetical protein